MSTTTFATTAYWVALLRYIGCTGHAHEVATLFGDEIAIRAQTLVHDAANPAEVMSDVFAYATAGRSEEERDEIIRMLQQTAHEWAVHNFTSGCEVADMLVERLGFAPGCPRVSRFHVRALERQGLPHHARARRSRSPCASSTSVTTWRRSARIFSPDHAVEAARDRRDRTYDPMLADLFVEHGLGGSSSSARSTPGTPCSTSSRSLAGCSRATSSTTRSSSPPTSSTSSRRSWAATAVAARSSRPMRRACSGSPTRRPRRSAGPRSCTTSAPPRSRTPSSTSPPR